MRRCYVAGLDIGFQSDYTALIICEVFFAPAGAQYVPLLLERLALPCTAPDVTALVARRFGPGSAWQPGRDVLLCDATGCGLPMLHQLQQGRPAPVGVWCHSGAGAERGKDGVWRVSKQDLIMSGKLALEQHRLAIDPTLALVDVLVHELQGYRAIQRPTGHIAYAAADWRDEGKPHDDLVFSMCLICWWTEREARTPLAQGLDLGPALGLRTPRMRPAPVPGLRDARPRWEERVWADEIPQQTFDQHGWDRAKEAFARGERPAHGPWRPEQRG